jgi:hypothetical protein
LSSSYMSFIYLLLNCFSLCKDEWCYFFTVDTIYL